MNNENKTNLSEAAEDDKQKGSGNFPWNYKSGLEKETEKELDPANNSQVMQTIAEVLDKVNRGPIYLEKKNHPYLKPTLKTLYAQRSMQVVAEEKVTIPIHLIDNIAEAVITGLKSQTHTFETPINVLYEQRDNAGIVYIAKTGNSKQYRFSNIEKNHGSLTAVLECIVDWNE